MKRKNTDEQNEGQEEVTATIAATGESETKKQKVGEEDNEIIKKAFAACTKGEHFATLAQFLMTDCVLQIANASYQIAEIEFYYFEKSDDSNAKVHDDIFAHCNPLQLSSLKWYFHQTSATKPNSFKAGSYKGLDITFSPNGKSYGGILLRAIYALDKTDAKKEVDNYVEGPSLLVDTVLKTNQIESIADLVIKKWNNDIDALSHPELKLMLANSKQKAQFKTTLVTSPRVGLTLNGSRDVQEARLFYIMKPYRFLAYPHLMSKGKTIAVLMSYHAELQKRKQTNPNNSKVEQEVLTHVENTFKVKKKLLQNYLEEFQKGATEWEKIQKVTDPKEKKKQLNEHVEKYFGQKFNNSDLHELLGFLIDYQPL